MAYYQQDDHQLEDPQEDPELVEKRRKEDQKRRLQKLERALVCRHYLPHFHPGALQLSLCSDLDDPWESLLADLRFCNDVNILVDGSQVAADDFAARFGITTCGGSLALRGVQVTSVQFDLQTEQAFSGHWNGPLELQLRWAQDAAAHAAAMAAAAAAAAAPAGKPLTVMIKSSYGKIMWCTSTRAA